MTFPWHMEHITGTIERVTFHNPENGFVVLRAAVAGRRELVAVVGCTPRAVAGEHFEADGLWKQDPEHGLQFQAEELRTTPPHTPEGIEKYLGSGLVKGIGPHYARKIVQVFGPRTLQVIDESPAFLAEVKGIGPRRIQRIRASWQQQKAVRDIMVFLQSHGIGTARALRIYKTYGDQAVAKVREDPYRLATDIWGIGFQTADELARRLGLDPQSVERARAAPALRAPAGERRGARGVCGVGGAGDRPRPDGHHSRRAGPRRRGPGGPRRHGARGDADADAVALSAAAVSRGGRDGAAAAGAVGRDASAGRHCCRRGDWRYRADDGADAGGPAARALCAALADKVLVITGGPGTGKSTLVRGILDVFEAQRLRCALAAPTGRAARRLAEATGRAAKTIHRLLELDVGGPKRGQDRPLDVDLLVVDEASMMDIVLANQLLRRCRRRRACCWSATSINCRRWGRARCWATSSSRASCRWCG